MAFVRVLDKDALKSFLRRHLEYVCAPDQKRIEYTFVEVMKLVKDAAAQLKSEPSLARINPPLVVVGDIHGQFSDLLRMFTLFRKFDAKGNQVNGALNTKYVFLGDYVDRGNRSLECICLCLALKLQYPKKYALLRGNHETRTINKVYGFYDELATRFSLEDADILWEQFNTLFAYMPLAGLIGKKILCMHGGISPALNSYADIENIPRPLEDPSTNSLAMDLMWSDPMSISGFAANTVRGVSCIFGEDAVTDVIKKLNIDMIIRAHQVQENGYGFFSNRQLVTVFSAARYQPDLANKAAVIVVSRQGKLQFKILSNDLNDETDTSATSKKKGASAEPSRGSKEDRDDTAFG